MSQDYSLVASPAEYLWLTIIEKNYVLKCTYKRERKILKLNGINQFNNSKCITGFQQKLSCNLISVTSILKFATPY